MIRNIILMNNRINDNKMERENRSNELINELCFYKLSELTEIKYLN
jgi:hypothetical protein